MRDHQTPTVFSLLKQQTPSQEAIEEYFLLFFLREKRKDNTEIIKGYLLYQSLTNFFLIIYLNFY